MVYVKYRYCSDTVVERSLPLLKQFKHPISSLCVKKAKNTPYNNKRKLKCFQEDCPTKFKEFQRYFVYINQIIHGSWNGKPFLPIFFCFILKKRIWAKDIVFCFCFFVSYLKKKFPKDIFIYKTKYFLWWFNKYGSIEQYG